MSNLIKFDFDVTYKEIEVGDKVYRMDMDDEARERIVNLYDRAKELSDEGAKRNTEDMSKAEIKTFLDEQRDFGIEMIDAFLGEGAGTELYEKMGKSTANMTKLAKKLRDMYEEFNAEAYEDEKKKFVKKGK